MALDAALDRIGRALATPRGFIAFLTAYIVLQFALRGYLLPCASGDDVVQLDLSTLRRIPFEEDTLLLIGSFKGPHADVCPRTILSRTLEKAASMGFGVDAAFEYEFFLFDETPDSVREKGYRNLDPFTPGMFGYSVLRNSVHAEFYHDLLDLKGQTLRL